MEESRSNPLLESDTMHCSMNSTRHPGARSCSHSNIVPPSLQNVDLEGYIARSVTGVPSRAGASAAGVPTHSPEYMFGPDADGHDGEGDLLSPHADPSLLSQEGWLFGYAHQSTEDWFVLFSQRNKDSLAVTSSVAALMWLLAFSKPQREYRYQSLILAVIHMAITLAHKIYMTHTAGVTKHAHLVWRSKVQEYLGIGILLCGLAVAFDIYPRGVRCLEGAHAKLGDVAARHYCLEQLWPFSLLYIPVPLVFLDIRQRFTVPLFVMVPIQIYLGSLLIPEEFRDETSVAVSKAFAGAILFCTIMWGLTVLETSYRLRFEAWVMMNRNTRKMKSQRVGLDTVLKNVIPAAFLTRLKNNEPVIFTSECCSLSVIQIFDFPKWSCSLLPKVLVETVDTFYTLLDRAIPDFGVSKVKTTGDRYLSTLGLVERLSNQKGSSSASTAPHNPAMMIQLGLWCLTVAERIEAALGVGFQFELQVAVQTGSCLGGIIGTQSLWFEVFGESFEKVLEIVRYCPRSAVLISEPTLELVQDQFICVENEGVNGVDFPVGAAPTYQVLADMQQEGEEPALDFVQPEGTFEEADGTGSVEQHLNCARREFLMDIVRKKHRLTVNEESFKPFRKSKEPTAITDSPLLRKQASPVQTDAQQQVNFFAYKGDSIGFADDLNILESERIQRLEGEFKLDSSQWTSLRFATSHSEAKYEQYLDYLMETPSSTHPATLSFLLMSMVILGCGFWENSHTTMSLALGFSNTALLLARLWHRRTFSNVPKRELTVGVFVVINLYNTASLMEKSVTNASFAWILSLTLPTCCFFFHTLQWPMIALISALNFAFFWIAEYSHLQTIMFQSLLPSVVFVAAVFYAAFIGEVRTRNHFKDLAKCKAYEEASEREFLLTQTLLDMILPNYVVNAVVEKCNGSRKPIVHSLGDVCVAAVRFDQFTHTLKHLKRQDLLKFMESHITRIDESIARYREVVSKVHAIGDTMLLAGPLKEPEMLVDGLPLSRTVDVNFNVARDGATSLLSDDGFVLEDPLLRAALSLVDIVWNLKVTHQIPVTAVLGYGAGFAAVTGTVRPSFDILGTVSRTVMELLQAAPDGKGFVGMHQHFAKLLKDGRYELPRWSNDFEVGSRLRWRLRGCGVIYMHPLYVPDQCLDCCDASDTGSSDSWHFDAGI